MKIFRKKERSCGCTENCTSNAMQNTDPTKKPNEIKILGSGCAKCIALENAVRTAIAELGWNDHIQHITDFTEIAGYGVITTPALVFNGKVVSYGKILSVDEIKKILELER